MNTDRMRGELGAVATGQSFHAFKSVQMNLPLRLFKQIEECLQESRQSVQLDDRRLRFDSVILKAFI